jgi:hypothetical protein
VWSEDTGAEEPEEGGGGSHLPMHFDVAQKSFGYYISSDVDVVFHCWHMCSIIERNDFDGQGRFWTGRESPGNGGP